MKRLRTSAWLAAGWLLVAPASLFAFLAAPNSSVVLSKDGTKILVMVSPDPANDGASAVVLPDERVLPISATFAKSGVYDIATSKPVWQVNWFARREDVRCSDDLRYVVRLCPYIPATHAALSFYDSGVLVGQYPSSQLLTRMAYRSCLPTDDGNAFDEFDLSADRASLLLTTQRRTTFLMGWEIPLGLRESYTFDLPSGRMTSRRVEGAWVVWYYLALALAIVAALAARLRLVCRRRFIDTGTPL